MSYNYSQIVGSLCYAVMISLGGQFATPTSAHLADQWETEMISYLPLPGGHLKLAER